MVLRLQSIQINHSQGNNHTDNEQHLQCGTGTTDSQCSANTTRMECCAASAKSIIAGTVSSIMQRTDILTLLPNRSLS
jgi:hypothetical protein